MKKISLLILVVIFLILAWLIFFLLQSTRAPSLPSQATGVQAIAKLNYACRNAKSIQATYYQGASQPAPSAKQPPIPGGSVALVLSDGRNLTLKQTLSADGVRYANPDESFVFWNKGRSALVLENNAEKSYLGCIEVSPLTAGSNLTKVYSDPQGIFSVRLPADYKIDANYRYQNLGPGKDIAGVKFSIPQALAAGTNLGADSYLSIESLPQAQNCSASLFLSSGAKISSENDNGTDYSVAELSDAAAGNRYDETVYATPTIHDCIAVRYFIHYANFDNYSAGMVKEFDQAALLKQFDQIRRSLVLN